MSAMKIPGLVFLIGCALIAGCGNKGPTSESATSATGGGPKVPAKADKLVSTDTVVGKGLKAAPGDTVWVQYRGTLKDGTEFDSNMKGDKDVYTFMLGQGVVVKGWDDGIPGMQVGGTRKVHVPASFGYGANGSGKIPPNADLDFEIKLLGLQKAGEENVIDTTDLKPGSGRTAQGGDTVSIQYVGTLLSGKVFDDSHKLKKPFTFTIGRGQTLSCIEEGVTGMKIGGRRKIVAPPGTAYVARPTAAVPANSEVVFVVDLISIK